MVKGKKRKAGRGFHSDPIRHGFSSRSIRHSHQYAHDTVFNGKRVNVPSFALSAADLLAVDPDLLERVERGDANLDDLSLEEQVAIASELKERIKHGAMSQEDKEHYMGIINTIVNQYRYDEDTGEPLANISSVGIYTIPEYGPVTMFDSNGEPVIIGTRVPYETIYRGQKNTRWSRTIDTSFNYEKNIDLIIKLAELKEKVNESNLMRDYNNDTPDGLDKMDETLARIQAKLSGVKGRSASTEQVMLDDISQDLSIDQKMIQIIKEGKGLEELAEISGEAINVEQGIWIHGGQIMLGRSPKEKESLARGLALHEIGHSLYTLDMEFLWTDKMKQMAKAGSNEERIVNNMINISEDARLTRNLIKTARRPREINKDLMTVAYRVHNVAGQGSIDTTMRYIKNRLEKDKGDAKNLYEDMNFPIGIMNIMAHFNVPLPAEQMQSLVISTYYDGTLSDDMAQIEADLAAGLNTPLVQKYNEALADAQSTPFWRFWWERDTITDDDIEGNPRPDGWVASDYIRAMYQAPSTYASYVPMERLLHRLFTTYAVADQVNPEEANDTEQGQDQQQQQGQEGQSGQQEQQGQQGQQGQGGQQGQQQRGGDTGEGEGEGSGGTGQSQEGEGPEGEQREGEGGGDGQDGQKQEGSQKGGGGEQGEQGEESGESGGGDSSESGEDADGQEGQGGGDGKKGDGDKQGQGQGGQGAGDDGQPLSNSTIDPNADLDFSKGKRDLDREAEQNRQEEGGGGKSDESGAPKDGKGSGTPVPSPKDRTADAGDPIDDLPMGDMGQDSGGDTIGNGGGGSIDKTGMTKDGGDQDKSNKPLGRSTNGKAPETKPMDEQKKKDIENILKDMGNEINKAVKKDKGNPLDEITAADDKNPDGSDIEKPDIPGGSGRDRTEEIENLITQAAKQDKLEEEFKQRIPKLEELHRGNGNSNPVDVRLSSKHKSQARKISKAIINKVDKKLEDDFSEPVKRGTRVVSSRVASIVYDTRNARPFQKVTYQKKMLPPVNFWVVIDSSWSVGNKDFREEVLVTKVLDDAIKRVHKVVGPDMFPATIVPIVFGINGQRGSEAHPVALLSTKSDTIDRLRAATPTYQTLKMISERDKAILKQVNPRADPKAKNIVFILTDGEPTDNMTAGPDGRYSKIGPLKDKMEKNGKWKFIPLWLMENKQEVESKPLDQTWSKTFPTTKKVVASEAGDLVAKAIVKKINDDMNRYRG